MNITIKNEISLSEKLDRRVRLADYCRISFFFFLGSYGIFLKEQAQITPEQKSQGVETGSMVQIRFIVPTISIRRN